MGGGYVGATSRQGMRYDWAIRTARAHVLALYGLDVRLVEWMRREEWGAEAVEEDSGLFDRIAKLVVEVWKERGRRTTVRVRS